MTEKSWSVFETLPNPVCVLDQQRSLVYANEHFLAFFGLGQRVVRNKRALETVLSKGDGTGFVVNLDPATASFRLYSEVFLRNSQGQSLQQRVSVVPLIEEGESDSSATHFALYFHDTSVEIRLHEKYQAQLSENERLIARLQQRVRETQILRGIGDLNTNRNSISQILAAVSNMLMAHPQWQMAHMVACDPSVDCLGKALEQAGTDSDFVQVLKEFDIDSVHINRNSYVILKSWLLVRTSPRLGPHLWLVARHNLTPEESKDFLPEFQSRLASLIETQQMALAANTDPLTGLYNRRYFDGASAIECSRSSEEGRALCLLIIDVDHFKQVNDKHGHPAGDEVLRQMAAVMRENVRKANLLARLGGEEFAVLLPETDAAAAGLAAERIRRAIEEHVFAINTGEQPLQLKLTASIGLAEVRRNDDIASLYDRADKALYEAKDQGRNKVRRAS